MPSIRLLIFCFVAFQPYSYSQEIRGTIINVYDGDTFVFSSGENTIRVRLDGIDCPEMNQPYGIHAKDFLSKFLDDSVSIIIRDYDKYGRTVADVFCRDTLLNYLLIERGLAWHFKKYSSDTTLANAEVIANRNHVGLWKESSPIAPWDWRAGRYDSSLFPQDNTSKVFICVTEKGGRYHQAQYCQKIRECSGSIIAVYPNEAVQVYGRAMCSKCNN